MIRANLRLRGSPSGRLVGQLAGQPLLKAGHSEVVQCAAVLEQVVSPTNLGTTVASCYQERQLRPPQSFLDAHSWTSGRAEGQLSLQQELAPFERGQHPEPPPLSTRGDAVARDPSGFLWIVLFIYTKTGDGAVCEQADSEG